jgi:hypothetical protein
LSIGPIDADSHDRRSEFSKLGLQITEMTAFLRSARCHGLDVEVHDQRACRQQFGQPNRGA